MARFDPKALYQALDGRRRSLGMSWQEVASDVGVSVSTTTRTRLGGRLGVDGVLAMVSWLGRTVESFVRKSDR